jgi:hypothetical protein
LGDHEVLLLLESIAIVVAGTEKQKLINKLQENAHRKSIDRASRQIVKTRGEDAVSRILEERVKHLTAKSQM